MWQLQYFLIHENLLILVKIKQKQSKAYNWNNLISYYPYSISNYTLQTYYVGNTYKVHCEVEFFIVPISVPDPWHFCTGPECGSGSRIRYLCRTYATFQTLLGSHYGLPWSVYGDYVWEVLLIRSCLQMRQKYFSVPHIFKGCRLPETQQQYCPCVVQFLYVFYKLTFLHKYL